MLARRAHTAIFSATMRDPMAAPDDNETAAHAAARAGLLAAIAAFAIWGVLPLYLRPLAHVPAVEIMSHRIVWCCLVVFAWLALRAEIGAVRAALADPRTRWRLASSAGLISL